MKLVCKGKQTIRVVALGRSWEAVGDSGACWPTEGSVQQMGRRPCLGGRMTEQAKSQRGWEATRLVREGARISTQLAKALPPFSQCTISPRRRLLKKASITATNQSQAGLKQSLLMVRKHFFSSLNNMLTPILTVLSTFGSSDSLLPPGLSVGNGYTSHSCQTNVGINCSATSQAQNESWGPALYFSSHLPPADLHPDAQLLDTEHCPSL